MRLASPQYRLGALAGLVTVAYWPAISSAPYMPRWWLIAIGVPLLLPLDPFRDRAIAMLALVGFSGLAIACVLEGDATNSLLPFYLFALIALTAWGAAGVGDIDPAMRLFSWGIALSAVVCLMQLFVDVPYIPVTPRPGALFFNSEVLAETAAPVLAWALVSRRWLLVVLLAVPMIVCGSKIAPAALALGLIWAWRAPLAIKIAALLLCAGIAIGALMSMDYWKTVTAAHRITLWGAAVLSVTPLGRGLGWWASAHPYPYEIFVHSDALQFMVEGGILAFWGFVSIPVVILLRGINDRAKGTCFVVLCVEAVVSFPLHMPATAFLFGIVAGGLCGDRLRLRAGQRERRTSRGEDVRWGTAHGWRGVAGRAPYRRTGPLGSQHEDRRAGASARSRTSLATGDA